MTALKNLQMQWTVCLYLSRSLEPRQYHNVIARTCMKRDPPVRVPCRLSYRAGDVELIRKIDEQAESAYQKADDEKSVHDLRMDKDVSEVR